MASAASPSYEFTAPRVVFGWGRRREVGRLAAAVGRRALVVSGAPALEESGALAEIADSLLAEGIETVHVETILREPEVDDVDRIAARVRAAGVRPGDFLLGVGGGAAIDLAKAVAAMATNSESPTVRDYLENVGRDLKLLQDPLPVIALPTTSGTGAEATRNAVISCYDPPFKKSLRSEKILPRIALVDPELTVSVPPAVTAAGGMDAITQLIESFISRKAQPIPCGLIREGLRGAMPALAEAVEHGKSRPAREKMAQAALLSGMALANSGLGMAHGVAAALGVHAHVPHGAACALMLPSALRINREAQRAELAEVAAIALDRPFAGEAAAVDALIAAVDSLCDRVRVPRRLSEVGIRREQIPSLVRDSRGSSMSGNPVELTDEQLARVLEDLL